LAENRPVRHAGWLVALAAALSGCVSQGIVTHQMPAETPAADNAAAIDKARALAAAQKQTESERESGEEPPALTPSDAPSMRTYDPWERFNRFNYRFNARFDEAVFLPVANGYRRLPTPIRSGVHNFFGNLAEIDSIINYTLQGRLGRGVRSLGRFVVNSTIGIGGLFDFASKLHLVKAPTGFGTTLATWGMHPGPYLVIPILGPSTLREAVGLLGDYGALYGINIANLYRGDQSWGLGLLDAVDTRSDIGFRYYSTGSPFEYDDVRFLYVRKLLLEDAGLHKKAVPARLPAGVPAGQ
jgi:phospholipid-binding lipoprotein MlaA